MLKILSLLSLTIFGLSLVTESAEAAVTARKKVVEEDDSDDEVAPKRKAKKPVAKKTVAKKPVAKKPAKKTSHLSNAGANALTGIAHAGTALAGDLAKHKMSLDHKKALAKKHQLAEEKAEKLQAQKEEKAEKLQAQKEEKAEKLRLQKEEEAEKLRLQKEEEEHKQNDPAEQRKLKAALRKQQMEEKKALKIQEQEEKLQACEDAKENIDTQALSDPEATKDLNKEIKKECKLPKGIKEIESKICEDFKDGETAGKLAENALGAKKCAGLYNKENKDEPLTLAKDPDSDSKIKVYFTPDAAEEAGLNTKEEEEEEEEKPAKEKKEVTPAVDKCAGLGRLSRMRCLQEQQK